MYYRPLHYIFLFVCVVLSGACWWLGLTQGASVSGAIRDLEIRETLMSVALRNELVGKIDNMLWLFVCAQGLLVVGFSLVFDLVVEHQKRKTLTVAEHVGDLHDYRQAPGGP